LSARAVSPRPLHQLAHQLLIQGIRLTGGYRIVGILHAGYHLGHRCAPWSGVTPNVWLCRTFGGDGL